MMVAMVGRYTPLIRPTTMADAASAAPVDPGNTAASTFAVLDEAGRNDHRRVGLVSNRTPGVLAHLDDLRSVSDGEVGVQVLELTPQHGSSPTRTTS